MGLAALGAGGRRFKSFRSDQESKEGSALLRSLFLCPPPCEQHLFPQWVRVVCAIQNTLFLFFTKENYLPSMAKYDKSPATFSKILYGKIFIKNYKSSLYKNLDYVSISRVA